MSLLILHSMLSTKEIRKGINKYLKPNNALSLFKVLLNFGVIFICVFLGVYWYDNLFWLVPLLWLPLIITISRAFLFIHDTGHYNMFSSRLMNEFVGRTAGFITTFPYNLWQYVHNYHHKNFANLDQRKYNPEIWILTKDEYLSSSKARQRYYRFVRSKFARLFLIPFINFLLTRIPSKRGSIKSNTSILISDVVYIVFFYLIFHFNIAPEFMWVYGFPWYFSYALVAMIFYMQHQYEEVQWYSEDNWDLLEASVNGASFMDFGPVINYLSENVRYHHVHHYNSGIPSVHLPDVHNELFVDRTINEISFSTFYRCLDLKLWDVDNNKMIPIPKK